jgi:hypothetical protein
MPSDQTSQASGSGSNTPVPLSSLPVRKRKQAMESVQRISNDEGHKESAVEKGSATPTSSIPTIGEEEWGSSDDEDHDKRDSDAAKEGSTGYMEEVESEGEGGKGELKNLTGKAREIRLEQNRKAARESRRRKKMMIEELQRSVIFFSKRNAALKKENEDLTRMLVQAQTQIQAQGGGANVVGSTQPKQEQQQISGNTVTPTNVVPVSEHQQQQQQEPMDAQQAMQQLLSQLNAASAMQHGGGGGGAQQVRSESSNGQQTSTGGGKSTQELQAAAIQAMTAARSILPQAAASAGGFGFDTQGNPIANPFGQFMGQQFQAAGQQFFSMPLGAPTGGLGAPNASYGMPFPYGAIPQQHFFPFPGAAGAQGMPNLLQQQQQTGQQQQQGGQQ